MILRAGHIDVKALLSGRHHITHTDRCNTIGNRFIDVDGHQLVSLQAGYFLPQLIIDLQKLAVVRTGIQSCIGACYIVCNQGIQHFLGILPQLGILRNTIHPFSRF